MSYADSAPDPASVAAEPLRGLLSPGVLQHRYGSAGWQRWLRGELAARARKVTRPGGSGLPCVAELAARCLADSEFRPITEGHTWDDPEALVESLLEQWHYHRAVPIFSAAALSLAHQAPDVPAAWWERDPSFGVYRAFLRACRANTAAWLARHGVRSAWLWRGENTPVDHPWTLAPLTFWTPIAVYGWRFARLDRIGRVAGGRLLLAHVPAERIASLGGVGVGQPHLGEVLVDGGSGPLEAWTWPIPGPDAELAEPEDGELERWLLGGSHPTLAPASLPVPSDGGRPCRPLG